MPVLEKTIEPIQNSVVVTKSLEDLLDEHLTPAEKKNLNLLIGREDSAETDSRKEDANAISPDSSADIDDLSDKEITLNNFDKLLNGQSDRSDNSSNSQDTVVRAKQEDPGECDAIENCVEEELNNNFEDGIEPEESVVAESEMTNSKWCMRAWQNSLSCRTIYERSRPVRVRHLEARSLSHHEPKRRFRKTVPATYVT